MQFSFEVNPDLDVAIGVEADAVEFSEVEEGYQGESYDLSTYQPLDPTDAKPGSEEKVRMLSARYAAGVPLWHECDCYDHGPADLAFGEANESDGFDQFEDEED